MSGHSVPIESALCAVKYGVLIGQYGNVRVYLYKGDHYFVPKKVWEQG